MKDFIKLDFNFIKLDFNPRLARSQLRKLGLLKKLDIGKDSVGFRYLNPTYKIGDRTSNQIRRYRMMISGVPLAIFGMTAS